MYHATMIILGAALSAAAATRPVGDSALALDTILTRIDAKAEAIHSVQAGFTQIDYDPVFDETDESQGVVRLVRHQPGDTNAPPLYRIRFDYLEPERSVTIVDASKVIVWTPDMQAPEESYLVDDTKMEALLAGFVSTERLREHYDVSIDEQTGHKVTLHLLPTSDQARQQLREMRVTFDKRTWLPTTIFHFKLNGQKVTFTFATVRLNVTIPATEFTVESLKPLLRKTKAAARPESADR
jgi:outer membrane lipoprotein-sorting protein